MGGNSSILKPDPSKLITVGSGRFPTYNDEHFAKIRAFIGLPDDFIESSFSFETKPKGGNMAPGGGKGGQLMGFTKDRLFIIKELNNTDHNTLLKVAEDFADHIVHPDGSLLCKIVAHFYHTGLMRNYIIMNNVTMSPKSKEEGKQAAKPKRRASQSYDLKGCNDDKILDLDGHRMEEVHKRIWNVHMWCGRCCWSDARKRYFDGKKAAYREQFHVTPSQKDDLMQWLRTSVHFLSERSLMDYSLMVSCVKFETSDPATAQLVADIEEQRATTVNGTSVSPFPFVSVVEGSVQVLHLGVIDYLQDWTCTKNLAMAIKVCERNKATVPPEDYGARFIRHFTDNFVGDATAYGAPAPVVASRV
mmetsp:Transcript_32796/g.42125  ORF Transcript_32796/g.42125 Transcript_32796/m.42125 type:complete len:361 (-) Transcript_32796:116-1198(-)